MPLVAQAVIAKKRGLEQEQWQNCEVAVIQSSRCSADILFQVNMREECL